MSVDISNMASGYWVNKFGRNPDIDIGDVADIWDYGGNGNAPDYPWPASAATTTVVSSSTADDEGSTGAITVSIQGLDANYSPITETVTMNGQSAVTCSNQFLRVFRAKVETAGSGGTNAGSIDVKHSTTILARITAGFGQTLMALYTVPAGRNAYLAGWHASMKLLSSGSEAVRIDVRPYGGAWNCKETLELGGSIAEHFYRKFSGWQEIKEKSDIRVRCFSGTDANTVVSAGFDLVVK